jgi:hypothetical protein
LLNTPNSKGWVGGPGWELAWESADVRPFPFAGEGGDVVRGVAEGFNFGRSEVGRDDYESVAFERCFEISGWSERHD